MSLCVNVSSEREWDGGQRREGWMIQKERIDNIDGRYGGGGHGGTVRGGIKRQK